MPAKEPKIRKPKLPKSIGERKSERLIPNKNMKNQKIFGQKINRPEKFWSIP